MARCRHCSQENPPVARFCMTCGGALEPIEARGDAEERKVVTVLFCDLVGFTALSGDIDPEDVKATLRPYHARVRQEIERWGGTVEKFIGDAVMAVFGAPIALEDDAERGVRTALRIVDAIDELNETDPRLPLAVRIGLNTGEAVVSLDAAAERQAFVAGDVVNMASRLQQVAPVGGVAVGAATYEATKELFEYQRLEPVEVKGREEPIAIWRAVAPWARYGSGVVRRSDRPFVGRDDELEVLRHIFARAGRQRSPQLVTIMGEPGVGKSRLVRAFFDFTDGLRELLFWRQGRCLPFGEGVTFWALGEVVKAEAGILDSDPTPVAAAKLERAVETRFDDPAEQAMIAKRLAPLVGLTSPDSPEGAERPEFFAAWRRFLEAMAANRPLVLVIEDLVWADPALVDFLEYLVDWSVDAPLMVLCTARPELFERHPGWGAGRRNSTTITLSPLTGNEIGQLIDDASSPFVLPSLVRDLVLERADGNPLYAEELVAMIAERTDIANGDDRLARTSIDVEVGLPGSIQAIIAARIDALSPRQKIVLQDAAVVGKVFWSGSLSAMSGLDEESIRDTLHELGRRELVRATRASSVEDQAEYSFWHILIRDVAYAGIPRTSRAKKHRTVAEWFKSIARERGADLAEIIAYHYESALELTRAAGNAEEVRLLTHPTRRSLIMAGDRAFGLDVRKARRHYRAALELFAGDDGERAKVLSKIAETAAREGRFADAEATYTEAIAQLRSRGDLLSAGDSMVRLSNVLWRRGDTSRSREVLGEAIATLERERPSIELANAYTEMAGNLAVLGKEPEAVISSTRAITLARSLGVEDAVPRALGFRGAARCYHGDLAGLDDLREALALAMSLGLEREAARMRGLLAEFLWATEGPTQALEISGHGIELANERGNTDLGMAFEAETLGPLFDLGRWDDLLEVADRVGRWADAHGERYFVLLARSQTARVMAYRGEASTAALLSSSILPTARDVGDPQVLVVALAAAALVEWVQGNAVAALRLIEEFERLTDDRPVTYRAQHVAELARICIALTELDTAERLLKLAEPSARRDVLSVLTARTSLDEARGNLESASQGFREAAEEWRRFGSVLEEGESWLGSGRALARLGRPEAVDALDRARAIFARLGATAELAEMGRWLEVATTAR